jgi:hypothetical protein
MYGKQKGGANLHANAHLAEELVDSRHLGYQHFTRLHQQEHIVRQLIHGLHVM